ncbi:MAG: peptidase S8, partial [Pseudomonadota bacterium]|nr:peptidase S8 [Pseudomonadota bacterium]
GEFFDAAAPVSRAEMAYSMVQALGLQADAEAFNADKVFALFRGEEVEVIDADLIPADLKGYVQQALAMNLMTVEYEVVQKPFSFETETVAKFNPSASISRGEAAFIITQFDTKR